MSLVPSPAVSGSSLASATALPNWFHSLKSALSDRRDLDAAVALKDAADWVEVFGQKANTSTAHVASSSRGGARASRNKGGPVNNRDLSVKPPSKFIPSRVPKNILSSVTWDVVKVRFSNSTIVNTLFESNSSFNLSLHPQASSWQSLFDQWCIPMASVTWYVPNAPGSTAPNLELHTAIDFDNGATLGNIQALDNFDSASIDVIGSGQHWSKTRTVRPCVKLTGANPTSVLTRQWCDSSAPSTPWYGIRMMAPPTPGSSTGFTAEITVWYAFRNRI